VLDMGTNAGTTAKADAFLNGKRILIIGGTGSLGQVLLSRIFDGQAGKALKVVLLSRDEEKQHRLRTQYRRVHSATHDIRYQNADMLEFRIGDVRDLHAVAAALRDIDIVINASALKQVPACEYFPHEAVMTNVHGAENIVRAIREFKLPIETVVGISTDKAVNPVSVMGMTKAIQERIFTRASLDVPDTRFVVVRYGNVLASRGSVIPLFHDQIRYGGPVTITDSAMTRFLLSLHDAVEIIFDALKNAGTSETYVPRLRGARIVDVAQALIGDRPVKTLFTGIRPGEKLHEVLISDEESHRTIERGGYFIIVPILPELRRGAIDKQPLPGEYSSKTDLMSFDDVRDLLTRSDLMVDKPALTGTGELLR
jgi:FlaA1/EpsC-like NDP-sugar epimerase